MLLLPVVPFALALCFKSYVWAGPVRRAVGGKILFEGRAPLNLTEADLDASKGPFSTVVRGSQKADQYFQLLAQENVDPTPLWQQAVKEQAIRVKTDNTSVFVPGGNGQPQLGFRRAELLAQSTDQTASTAFDSTLETGRTAFHFSVQAENSLPLNFAHEYQTVFIEPTDGSHTFELQTGTPFNTTTSDADARTLKIRSHNLTVLFNTPFDGQSWHNFAIVVDAVKSTLQVFYSQNGDSLKAVTNVEDNSSVTKGAQGQGDFHIGMVKLPLINPKDSPQNQADVAHHGIQEGKTEGLRYSGIFVEDAQNEISISNCQTVSIGN